MRYLNYAALAALLSFSACQSGETNEQTTETTTTAPVPAADPQTNLGEAGTQRLLSTLNEYYKLKDALVASDLAQTDAGAQALAQSADSLVAGLSPEQQSQLQPFADSVKTGSMDILSATADIEQKRIPFEQVSNNMYALLKAAGLQHGNVYQQYCPMAFNDKGAAWLSDKEEIRNPYFGKKMLMCGEITDSL